MIEPLIEELFKPLPKKDVIERFLESATLVRSEEYDCSDEWADTIIHYIGSDTEIVINEWLADELGADEGHPDNMYYHEYLYSMCVAMFKELKDSKPFYSADRQEESELYGTKGMVRGLPVIQFDQAQYAEYGEYKTYSMSPETAQKLLKKVKK